MFAEVAFPIRSYQTFTYLIPNDQLSEIHVGTRVYVPFKSKTIQGVVVYIKNTNSYTGSLKQIIKPIDDIKLITPSLWRLIKWVSKYYMTPIGKVANSVVPKSLSSSYKPRPEKYVRLKKNIDVEEINILKKTAPKQYIVLKTLVKDSGFYKVSYLKNIVLNQIPGELSEPVKSSLGWHLISVREIASGQLQLDKDLFERAKRLLRLKKIDEAYVDWIDFTKSRSQIKILDFNIY